MSELSTLVVFLVVTTAVVALTVYVAAKWVERRNPPVGEFLDVDGIRLHYFERGAGGFPVVFLHGNATMLQDFALSEVFTSAAENSQAIIFDRPGFGYSTRPRGRTWSASEQADVIAAALGHLKVGRYACRSFLGDAGRGCSCRAASDAGSIAGPFVRVLLSHPTL